MIKSFAQRVRDFMLAPVMQRLGDERIEQVANAAVSQKALLATYRQLHHSQAKPLPFADVGFSAHSQYEEDGILLYIFALIGATNRRCVEICCGDGVECNTANLIIEHGFNGLLVDGDDANIARASDYYGNHRRTRHWPPVITKQWITRDNVNAICTQHGFAGEIDLLSLDIDGVDYWIFQALDAINPRVAVVEFNHLWGPTDAVTVPYRDDFVAEFTEHGSDYAGASLAAFVKLGKQKGYRLVGANAIATNAFFVRNDIACDWLPQIDPASCFDHPRAQFGITKRLPAVKDKPWERV